MNAVPSQDYPMEIEAVHAKQRASVKWLLSKAFNNRVPENLLEPFYRDHEGQDHLKPQIVVELGNAALYCQTLSNLYSDPNYQSLNHWSILQTLARKGVPLNELNNVQLTETVLIQTNPLRVSAHMAVIEALMVLYAKEIATRDRISNVIFRISGGALPDAIQGYENTLLYWVSHAGAALKRRIDYEIEMGATDQNGVRYQSPQIPPIRSYKDLCDGVCIAFLVAHYCPQVLSWTDVRVNHLPSLEDAIHNTLLVMNFSQKHLPYSVFHMTPEDISYMRGSMRTNLIVLLADLFNLFEIHPAKCVVSPGPEGYPVSKSASGTLMKQQHPQVPHRATPPKDSFSLMGNAPPSSQQHQQQQQPLQPPATDENGFVVHRGRGVPTLASLNNQQKGNSEYKGDEAMIPAGRPSDKGERRPSYAGRRSRRNSLTDDSQLTIENFGGSQDHLNLVGRLEKERDKERDRKLSTASLNQCEPAVAIRSSLQDARSSLQFGYDVESEQLEKQDRAEKAAIQRQGSLDASPKAPEEVKKITSFATLPNTTTWQKQSEYSQKPGGDSFLEDNRSNVDAGKLSSVRMKLEEKRRQIEMEKRKLELALSKQQQKVGQAAFLQTINKDYPAAGEPKWADMTGEPKRTPDVEQMDLEQYQQIITTMNMSLHEIQADIQRLTQQQTQNQAHQLHAQQLMQAQQIANILNQYGSQQNLSTAGGGFHNNRSPIQPMSLNFGSTPHLSQHHQQLQSGFQGSNYGGTMTMRSAPQNREYPTNPYVDEQGRYVGQRDYQVYHQEMQPQMMNNNGMGLGGQYEQQAPSNVGYPSPHMPLHKNFLSRENLNQAAQQSYGGVNNANNTNHTFSGVPQQPMQSHQFYLHDQNSGSNGSPPVAPPRRTWAESAAMQAKPMADLSFGSPQSASPKPNSSGGGSSAGGGFMLHQNGRNSDFLNESADLFQVQTNSPKHNSRVHRQISQLLEKSPGYSDGPAQSGMPKSPAIDEMAPQSISFIGDQDSVDNLPLNQSMKIQQLFSPRNNRTDSMDSGNQDQMQLEASLGKMNISSGSRTYRIPSPTRPVMTSKSFQDPNEDAEANNGKGFYIQFDNEAPKRPKPPLRTKRSPKKDPSETSVRSSEVSSSSDQRFQTMTTRSRVQERDEVDPVMMNHHTPQRSYEPQQHRSVSSENDSTHDQYQQMYSQPSRKHLEDVTNFEPQSSVQSFSPNGSQNDSDQYSGGRAHHEDLNKPIIIADPILDPNSIDEMEKKKERIMLMSLQRRQQQEEAKATKEANAMRRREKEQQKEEEKMRKKEDQAARRQAILEAHKLKKAIEEAEREGKVIDKADLMMLKQAQQQLQVNSSTVRRPQKNTRPRPKTIHVESGSVDMSDNSSSIASSRSKKGSNSNLTGIGRTLSSTSIKRDYYRGSQDSLAIREPSQTTTHHPTMERGRTMSRISVPKGVAANFRGRKSNSLMNLCDSDSGLGRATPPRRAPSPGMGGGQHHAGMGRHLPSPSGPGSLPPGLISKRRTFDDGSSDISSAQSSMMDYTGPKLYKQPAAKSNRGIILNAVEYCVFPGVVNRDAKQKVLEKIARSEAKHFLILFRDAGCQFRALYSYNPETEQVVKLFGTGPSQVDEYMFDKFFKYNSGGKCFSQIHTKHLTVTIDAFTIHNSLWQGKKVPNLPSKKDMTLVI